MHRIAQNTNQSTEKKQEKQKLTLHSSSSKNVVTLEQQNSEFENCESKTSKFALRKQIFEKQKIEFEFDFLSLKNILPKDFFLRRRKKIAAFLKVDNVSKNSANVLDFIIQMTFEKGINCVSNGLYTFFTDDLMMQEKFIAARNTCTRTRNFWKGHNVLLASREYGKGRMHYKLNFDKVLRMIFEIGFDDDDPDLNLMLFADKMSINCGEKSRNICKKLSNVLGLKIKSRNFQTLFNKKYNSNEKKNFSTFDYENYKVEVKKYPVKEHLKSPNKFLLLIHSKLSPNKRFCFEYFLSFIEKKIGNELVTLNQLIARCVAWAKRQFIGKRLSKLIFKGYADLADVQPFSTNKMEFMSNLIEKSGILSKIHDRLPENKTFGREIITTILKKKFSKIYSSVKMTTDHFVNFCVCVMKKEIAPDLVVSTVFEKKIEYKKEEETKGLKTLKQGIFNILDKINFSV